MRETVGIARAKASILACFMLRARSATVIERALHDVVKDSVLSRARNAAVTPTITGLVDSAVVHASLVQARYRRPGLGTTAAGNSQLRGSMPGTDQDKLQETRPARGLFGAIAGRSMQHDLPRRLKHAACLVLCATTTPRSPPACLQRRSDSNLSPLRRPRIDVAVPLTALATTTSVGSNVCKARRLQRSCARARSVPAVEDGPNSLLSQRTTPEGGPSSTPRIITSHFHPRSTALSTLALSL